jgi:D-methionine transport system permease protein
MNAENIDLALKLLPLEFLNTIYMVFASAFFAVIIGLGIGIILSVTAPGHIKECRPLYKVLEVLVNVGRSFPFAILLVALIPFTRFVVGTSLGTTATIVPLTIAAIPFFARLVETSLNDVDSNILEAAIVMGASGWQIIFKVLLPEAKPAIISAITLTVISLIGYSAMAGLVGGGGLGQVAIQYGYNRFNTFIMVLTVVILIVLVQLIQAFGEYVKRLVSHV